MILGNWTTIRAFSATQAEATSVAQAATFVSLGTLGPQIEVRGQWGADGNDSDANPLGTGATNPTGVTVAIWRKREGKIDKLGTMFFSVSSNSIVARETAIFDFDARDAYATVDGFVAGATPTLTGYLEARVIA